MAKYELHCFAQSGNAYKPALMLTLNNADWAPVFVDFFNGDSRTPDFLAMNEMGEVPVLRHRGRTISQSGVILHYLSEKLGAYGAETPEEQREILRWMLWDNHKLTSYTATLRFMRQFAKTGETPVTEFLEGRAKTAFKVLDRHLAGREWIVASRPTIADMSACGYLFWPDEIGIDFSAYAHVSAWLDRIRSLPGWRHPYDLMPDHPRPEQN